ncbi:MAG: hypothetical protein ACYDDF_14575 [Thermoplasmatota archaeon]
MNPQKPVNDIDERIDVRWKDMVGERDLMMGPARTRLCDLVNDDRPQRSRFGSEGTPWRFIRGFFVPHFAGKTRHASP